MSPDSEAVLALSPTLLVDQAAAVAAVSRRTIYHWMRWGWLPFTRHHGSRRVKLADVALLTGKRRRHR